MNRLLFAAAALVGMALPAAAQTLTAVINADIRSSNPGVNRDDKTDEVVLHVVEGLVGYAEGGQVGALLAEKVDLSPDGKTYTFTLRKGVKFHNGAEMTSADVLWSWNRYMDPKTEWRCLAEFDGRSGLKVEQVAAPDPFTFVMAIDKPNALFLNALARTDCGMTAILHKDSVKADGSWDRPIGTGPFKFAEWKRSEYVRLTRFGGYQSLPGHTVNGYVGSKRPLVDEVKLLVVPDPATVKAGLLSGALDAAQILSSDMSELKANPKLVVETSPVASKHSLLLQTRDPLLSNVKLRQAIAASLDMEQLVAGASDGLGMPSNSAVFRLSSYYDDVQKQGYRYDPEKARQLLKEAGYKGETITILANKRVNVPSYPAALIAQAMMQVVGIKAEVEVIEWPTQLDRYNSGKFQMMSTSYSAQLDPALSYDQFMGPKDKEPRKAWDNPYAQAFLDRAMVISDHAERQKIFDELHRLQLEDTPAIFMYGGVGLNAHSAWVKGSFFWQGKPRLWETSVVR